MTDGVSPCEDCGRYIRTRLLNEHGVCPPCGRRRDKIKAGAKNRRSLIHGYGITVQDHAKLAVAQRHRCAICRKKPSGGDKSLAIDHDHETGKVRGLLCSRCNLSIGAFDDDVDLLRRAVDYLESPPAARVIPNQGVAGR